MIKPKFFGVIHNGKFYHKEAAAFANYIQKFEGRDMEMTISPKYKRRTQGDPGEETNFNGYWWAVIIRIIADAIGEADDNVVHNMLQMLFNKKAYSTIDPETKQRINIEVPRGTKNLSGGEFAEMCSRVRVWASIPGNLCEHGCFIPEPNEVEYE